MNDKWMHPTSKLAIIGGIQVNVDGPKNDKFVPLMFEVRNRNGEVEDLFESTFKRESPIVEFKKR